MKKLTWKDKEYPSSHWVSLSQVGKIEFANTHCQSEFHAVNDISEFLQVSSQRKEKECRKCKKCNCKFYKKCCQSLETEFQTCSDLHEVFVKSNEFGKFQCGSENSEGHDIIVIVIDQKSIGDSYVNISMSFINSFDKISDNHTSKTIQN